jgi:hypothetical protein
MMRKTVGTLLATLALGATGCDGLTYGAGSRPEGQRLISGELVIADDGILGRQVTGLQLAAVWVGEQGDTLVPVVHPSDVLEPDGVRGADFVIVAPQDRALHLLLQVPAASAGVPGSFLGVLRFNDTMLGSTSLIPAGVEDLELDAVQALENEPGDVADNELKVQSAFHPLGQMDSDQDGIADLLDEDDDDDQIADSADADVAGDGVDDALQQLSALPDEDADGVPDAFEP